MKIESWEQFYGCIIASYKNLRIIFKDLICGLKTSAMVTKTLCMPNIDIGSRYILLQIFVYNYGCLVWNIFIVGKLENYICMCKTILVKVFVLSTNLVMHVVLLLTSPFAKLFFLHEMCCSSFYGVYFFYCIIVCT